MAQVILILTPVSHSDYLTGDFPHLKILNSHLGVVLPRLDLLVSLEPQVEPIFSQLVGDSAKAKLSTATPAASPGYQLADS
jgi:hypothetical protein